MSRAPSSSRPGAPPPERLGDYLVGPRIGSGGMGRVHEATHLPSGRQVAIKLVQEGASERACARLLREARTARAAAGEHVVEVLDAGVGDDGLPFVAMERLDGADLGAVLRREGRLDLETTLRVATELLRGLERVHAAGVVHRDLKPENLVLLGCAEGAPPGPDVALKIVDFGVSKVRTQGVLVPGSLTREGVVLGTPLYSSPEQAQGLPDVDERSDLWSTGAIVYQCLAGRAPHAGATYEQIVVAVCSTDAPDVRTWNPAVPAPIARVLARALARDRRRRFADARAMREALERAAGGDEAAFEHEGGTEPASDPIALERVPGGAGLPTVPVPLRRPRGRRPRAPGILVGAASLVAGGALALLALHALGLDAPAVDDATSSTSPPSGADAPPTLLAPQVVHDDAERARQPVALEAPAIAASAEASPTRVAPTHVAAPRGGTPHSPSRRGVAAGLELRER